MIIIIKKWNIGGKKYIFINGIIIELSVFILFDFKVILINLYLKCFYVIRVLNLKLKEI